jgi:hypothetical protein
MTLVEKHMTNGADEFSCRGPHEVFASPYFAMVNTAEPDVTALLAPSSTITICTPT